MVWKCPPLNLINWNNFWKWKDMNQADKDAQKWQEMNSKTQQYDLIKAKELGTPYYINQYGDVIHDKTRKCLSNSKSSK